jgi:hypothetical protein
MRRRRPARDLRTAIDCLPLQTREAMLDAIATGRIIAGAYTDRQGGVCPMLAAHRNGGRTSLASFARAWDRYTGARRARAATPRELTALRSMLEASIEMEEPSLHDVPRPEPAPEPDHPIGWAWLRPVTSFDAYASALAALDLAVARPDELELRDDAVARSAQ